VTFHGTFSSDEYKQVIIQTMPALSDAKNSLDDPALFAHVHACGGQSSALYTIETGPPVSSDRDTCLQSSA